MQRLYLYKTLDKVIFHEMLSMTCKPTTFYNVFKKQIRSNK